MATENHASLAGMDRVPTQVARPIRGEKSHSMCEAGVGVTLLESDAVA